MLKQLTFAMLATVARGPAVSTANAARATCPVWACGANGSSMDGVAGRPSDGRDRYEARRSGCGIWHCGSNGASYDGIAGRPPGDDDRYEARDGRCDEWGRGPNGTSLNGVEAWPSVDDDRYEARGGDCDDWGCGMNGASYQGTLLTGSHAPTDGMTVTAVILRSGERVDLAPAASATEGRR